MLVMPAMAEELQLYFVHNDHLGTPVVVTDGSQKVVWAAEKTPFGETTVLVQGVEQPLRFPGQYYDEETGLHYNYYRDYDPGLGRYVQSDPIGLGGGINTYGYVRGNPVLRIDPYGLADYFFGFEADLTGIVGVEMAFGFVVDTDSPLESGVFGSFGMGVGANVGLGVTAGYAECDIEGSSTGVDVNYGPASYYGGVGSDSGRYGGISIGLGIGASANISETRTYSFGDYIDWALGK